MTVFEQFIAWIKENFDGTPELPPHDNETQVFIQMDDLYYGPVEREDITDFLYTLPPDESIEFAEYLQNGVVLAAPHN